MAHSGEADVSRGCRQEGAGPQRAGRVVSRAAVGGVYPARHRRNPSSRVSRRRSASAPVSAIRRGRSRFWGPPSSCALIATPPASSMASEGSDNPGSRAYVSGAAWGPYTPSATICERRAIARPSALKCRCRCCPPTGLLRIQSRKGSWSLLGTDPPAVGLSVRGRVPVTWKREADASGERTWSDSSSGQPRRTAAGSAFTCTSSLADSVSSCEPAV